MNFTSLRNAALSAACCAAALLTGMNAVMADGMVGDRPKAKVQRSAPPRVAPPPPPAPLAETPVRPAPAPVVMEEEGPCCTPNVRISGGLPIWFFDKESNLPGAGGALDFWCDELPVNFRVGIEGRHMNLGQSAADFAREWPDKTTKITFIRIPFAAEYMYQVDESITAFFGGGPDIIRTANDLSETSVGMHLSGRLHYALTDEFGVSLEAGYMWGSVDGESGRNVRLNNTFITPMLTYTF